MSRQAIPLTIESLKARCVEEGDCWLWQGKFKNGRPVVGRKQVGVRRVVIELRTGRPMPPGKVASPKCGDQRCVCPEHALSQTVAKARALAASFGAYVSTARTLKRTLTVRARSRYSDEVIALVRAAPNATEAHRLHGISIDYAYQIRQGRRRAELNNPFAGLMR